MRTQQNEKMKKLHILIIAILISLSIFTLASMQPVNAASSIGLSPGSGQAGDTVTVSGVGFLAASTVTIEFNAVTQITNPSPVIANIQGQFTASFTVPAIAAGSYTILATDGANQATATFTVYSALSVNVGPSSVALDVAQSQDFTATPSGGSGGDSYKWYLNGAQVSGQTGPTYSFTASDNRFNFALRDRY